MTPEAIIKWLVHSPAMQRDKLTTVRERYVPVIREMYDDDLQRVVREIKKRINSKKLADEVAATLVEITRDRASKPRGETAPGDEAAANTIANTDRRTELEAAILADPDAQAPYLPYADWLESIGDPFGPLVAIDRELAKNPGHKAMLAARKQYFADHGRLLLGGLADCEDMLVDVGWHMGFIRKCKVIRNWNKRGSTLPDVPFADVLGWLLDDPGPGRFLQHLEILAEPRRETPATVVIAARPRRALRTLHLDWQEVSGVGAMWSALPELRELTMRPELADADQLIAAAAMPKLETLVLSFGEMDRARMRALSSAVWPSLRVLRVESNNYELLEHPEPADIEPLFDGVHCPKLERIALHGFHGGDDLCERIARSPILDQLLVLDLSRGTVGAAGVQALLAEPERLANLSIILDENFIPRENVELLRAAAKDVEAGGQRSDGGDPATRFVPSLE